VSGYAEVATFAFFQKFTYISMDRVLHKALSLFIDSGMVSAFSSSASTCGKGKWDSYTPERTELADVVVPLNPKS